MGLGSVSAIAAWDTMPLPRAPRPNSRVEEARHAAPTKSTQSMQPSLAPRDTVPGMGMVALLDRALAVGVRVGAGYVSILVRGERYAHGARAAG